MPLNADQLDAFWAVVQAGGFHRAAEVLNITQSAVTQRIQALEADLGHRVFVRAGRGVTLTEVGQILVRHCQERRNAEAELFRLLTGDGTGLVGRLAVGSGTAEGRMWVHPLLVRMGRENPDLDVHLTLGDSIDPVTLLETCQCDAIVSEIPVSRRGIRSERIRTVHYALVATPDLSRDWSDRPSGQELKAVRAIDFAPTDRITLDHLSLCLPGEDFSGLRRHYVNNTFAIVEWVLAGGGYSVLPLPLLERYAREGELRRLYPAVVSQRALYLSTPDVVPSPAVKRLAELLRAER